MNLPVRHDLVKDSRGKEGVAQSSGVKGTFSSKIDFFVNALLAKQRFKPKSKVCTRFRYALHRAAYLNKTILSFAGFSHLLGELGRKRERNKEAPESTERKTREKDREKERL